MFNKNNVKDLYELSPLQSGILFHCLRDHNSQAYFQQMDFELEGTLDLYCLEDSFNQLIQKYDVFRTIFVYEKVNRPVQVVLKERKARIFYKDISHLEEIEKERYIEDFKQQERERGFDLSRDLLIRLSLVKTGFQNYHLIWSFHHILMDGWCLGLVLGDLFQMYQQRLKNEKIVLDKAPSYSQYIRWLTKQNKKRAQTYWKEYLKGFSELTEITLKGQKEKQDHYVKKDVFFKLNGDLSIQLENLAKNYQVTLNTVFRAIWGILLQRYNHTDDVVFGTVVSGRPSEIPHVEKTVGLFINTIPVRIKCKPHERFDHLIKNIQHASSEAERYSYLSLADIQLNSELSSGLFDHLVAFENYPFDPESIDKKSEELGFIIKDVHTFEQTNYDFNLLVIPGKELTLKVSFNQAVYEIELIENLLKQLEWIMKQVIAQPDKPVGEIDIIPEEEWRKLMEFSHCKTDYPRNKTIHHLFEEQVEKTPERVALVWGDQCLTYRQLNQRANQLARYLRKSGVKAGDLVGISVERSIDLYVGILAILKTGGAYVPLDPHYPAERLTFLIEDTQLSMILTTSELLAKLPNHQAKVIDLDKERAQIEAEEKSNLSLLGSGDDIAYVMYTSGSTGKPKGILTKHHNVVRTIKNNGYIEISEEDRLLQLSSYAFDGSTFEIYAALLHGAELVIAPKHTVLNMAELAELIKNQAITVSFMTTALFNMIVDLDVSCLKSLRKILFGGEKVSVKHVKKAVEHLGENRLIHVYGPTETTVFATHYPIDHVHKLKSYTIPIGKPIANTKVYILDSHLKPVPIGVPGELYIGGDGVAREYLNRPDLTHERFIPNPFSNDRNERIYKTGDLVRYDSDGNIEFIDRLDNQVKIRGFRIELGEIEAVLRQHPLVKDTVVHVTDEKQFIAYIVPNKQETVPSSQWRQYLTTKLPDYMIPSAFIAMEAFPLNQNGKVDRKSLPKLTDGIQLATEYVAPTTKLEDTIAEIWKEVLQQKRVGIHDNFFDLGGHSLKAMMLVSRILKKLQVKVPIKVVFAQPTVKGIADYIKKVEVESAPAIEPVEKRKYYPVSSEQKRLYTIQLLDGVNTTYNMPLVLKVKGAFSYERLSKAFQALVQRHEAFRTSFHMVDGELVQKIEPSIAFQLEQLKAEKEDEITACIQSFIRPFDLSEAPLCRAGLIHLPKDEYILLLDMHHIISDGVSMGIIIRELTELYQDKHLPSLPLQYKDYAVWQKAFAETELYQKMEEYWFNQFSGELPVLDFPTDYSRASIQKFDGSLFSYELDEELTSKLKEFSSRHGVTLFMTLLASYNVLLSKYAKQEDIIVGTPVVGRSQSDLESVVGMFVNTIALRNFPKRDQTFRQFLANVKEQVLSAYEHADYPLEKLVEKLGVRRNLSRNPLFDTMFVLQNLDKVEFELPGLIIKEEPFEWKNAKVDMTWTISESEKLHILLEYSTQLFKPETIQRIVGHFIHILVQIVEKPDIALREIELLTEEEKQQILVEFNQTETIYPREKTVHEQFEEQVSKTPENIALVFKDQRLTYQELNQQANQLARVLRKNGVKREQVVGLMVDRSVNMIIGILAILKAGGAYLPIDPTYPSERIQYMLEDSGAELLLTQKDFAIPSSFKGSVMVLEQGVWAQEESSNLDNINSPEDLIYIIYTSGTTGKPKGILTTHRNVVKTCINNGYLKISQEDRILQLSNYAFDGSTFDIYGSLLHGAKLVLVPKDALLDLVELSQLIREEEITVSFMTTALFNTLVDLDIICLKNFRKILFGGEKVSAKHVKKAVEYLGEHRLIHVYGPTETTVFATYYSIDSSVFQTNIVPIGSPIANTKLYVLDESKQLQPIGVPGELWISGDGLARGYLNRPELTEKAFVPNPYLFGERMYKTGDIVRWQQDGTIEYIDRVDEQVKIRGHRIELGEIQNTLLENKSVREGIVVAHRGESGHSELCAYFVPEGKWSVAELRESMLKSLPEYMVPSYFIDLKKLPLNPNGKVDKKALPNPIEYVHQTQGFAEPTTPTEEMLVKIWKDILKIERIGIHDNFFELGGDSLKGMQLIAHLYKYHRRLSMKDLYLYPTISKLAPRIESVQVNDQEIVEGEVPITPIQKWIFELTRDQVHAVNINIVLESEKGWKIEAVKRAFQKMIEHHDALRMIFKREKEEIIQINRGLVEKAFDFRVIDLTNVKDVQAQMEKEVHQLNEKTDLTEGPLVKLSLFQTENQDYLVVSIHHLLMDDVSANILIDDFITSYQQALQNKPIVLPPKTASYQTWSKKLQVYANSEHLLNELPYWRKIETVPVASLPKDMEGPDVCPLEDLGIIPLLLTKEETKGLLDSIQEQRMEVFEVLLTALGLTIREWTKNGQILVNLERHGREEIMDGIDVSRTIGWFNAHSPIILPIQTEEWISALQSVQRVLKQVPNKGIGYGLLKYLTDPEKRDSIAFHLRPEISFNYHGVINQELREGFRQSILQVGNSFTSKFPIPFSLYVNAMILDGELQVRFGYSKYLYYRKTIKMLTEMYKEYLMQFIDKTCALREGRY